MTTGWPIQKKVAVGALTIGVGVVAIGAGFALYDKYHKKPDDWVAGCSGDQDCDSNSYCNPSTKLCTKRCKDATECKAGYDCVNGRCVMHGHVTPECTLARDCDPGYYCSDGVCVLNETRRDINDTYGIAKGSDVDLIINAVYMTPTWVGRLNDGRDVEVLFTDLLNNGSITATAINHDTQKASDHLAIPASRWKVIENGKGIRVWDPLNPQQQDVYMDITKDPHNLRLKCPTFWDGPIQVWVKSDSASDYADFWTSPY